MRAGAIIAHGAVALGDGVTLWGLGLSTVGAVPAYNNRDATPVGPNPLPEELVAFTALLQGQASVAVAWRTATEAHSARFEVERSTPVRLSPPLAPWRRRAPAAPFEPTPCSMVSCRLGRIEYATVPLQAYPNPTRGGEYVRVSGATAALRVFDGTGQLVRTQPAPAAGAEAVLPACPRASTRCAAARAASA